MVNWRQILIGIFAASLIVEIIVLLSSSFFGKDNLLSIIFQFILVILLFIQFFALPIAGLSYLAKVDNTKRRLGLYNSIVIAKQQVDKYRDTPGFDILVEYSQKNISSNWLATYGSDTNGALGFNDFKSKAYSYDEHDQEKLEMLQKVLLKRGVRSSIYGITSLLINISRMQFAQDLSKRLKVGTKLDLDSICERFVLEYGERATNPFLMDALIYVLVEEGLAKYDDKGDIKNKISSIREDISLKHFESNLKSKEQSLSLADIDQMNGHDFEDFLAHYVLTKSGFEILDVKKSGDQGGDIIASKFGKKLVVQAKRYAGNVGNNAIQEVAAARSHYNCDDAWVISNSYFTKAAKELAKSTQVRLVDRDELKKMI